MVLCTLAQLTHLLVATLMDLSPKALILFVISLSDKNW